MRPSVYERLERERFEAQRAALAADRKARELARLRDEHAGLRLDHALIRLQRLLARKYRPDQLRVPRGEDGAGRFADEGGGSGNGSSRRNARERQRLAQYSMGVLVAELPYLGGRNCVYKFDFGSVIVPGPRNFSCLPEVPSSAVTHGTLLNDN